MTGEFGYLVHRDDRPNWVPFAVDDPVTTYVLGEAWPFADLPPHEGCSEELFEYERNVIEHAMWPDDWRIQQQLHCDCKQRRVVAQLLVHIPSSRLWATAKPEKVPVAFRKPQHGLVDGWSLHGKPGQAPHVGGVASCKACDKRWLVLSFNDKVVLIRIAAAAHGAIIGT